MSGPETGRKPSAVNENREMMKPIMVPVRPIISRYFGSRLDVRLWPKLIMKAEMNRMMKFLVQTVGFFSSFRIAFSSMGTLPAIILLSVKSIAEKNHKSNIKYTTIEYYKLRKSACAGREKMLKYRIEN